MEHVPLVAGVEISVMVTILKSLLRTGMIIGTSVLVTKPVSSTVNCESVGLDVGESVGLVDGDCVLMCHMG